LGHIGHGRASSAHICNDSGIRRIGWGVIMFVYDFLVERQGMIAPSIIPSTGHTS
jgi:hypothetical protein